MSDFEKIAIGKQAQNVEVSPTLGSYSGVEIIVDEDTSIFSGDRTGRVLSFENEWGTQEQADAILSSLQGFQYQPYTADGALVNPAAEIGDGITVNGVYSGIYKMSRNYGSLMAANIEAPQSEAIDHEYPFETKQNRTYRREIANAQAQIRINQNSIESEVIRASQAEGTLASQITQTATGIRADVLSKTGGSSSSFGWNLTDSSWTLTSNGIDVMKATQNGIEVNGKIIATSGFIGNGESGFTIMPHSMYNGMNNINSESNGVYIGTDGIALGGGAFKATSSGAISANNLNLTGSLVVGGTAITAAALGQGAASAYNNGGYWSGGAGGGYAFSSAASAGGTPANVFRAMNLYALSGAYLEYATIYEGMRFDGYNVSWKQQYVITGVTPYTSNMYGYLTSTTSNRTMFSYVYNIGKSGTTIYYLGR